MRDQVRSARFRDHSQRRSRCEKLNKLSLLVACVLATSCASTSEVLPVGPETFTVSSGMTGQFPSWSDVKGLAIKRANDYCAGRGQVMEVVSWDLHGARGWSPLSADLTFKCVNAR